MPSPTEIKIEVAKEGSFVIDGIRVSHVDWNVSNINQLNKATSDVSLKGSGYNVAKYMRAVAEPILITHFGEEIMNELFIRYREILGDRMAKEKTQFVNVTVSLIKPK